jgi:dihydroorotate dehydrogenase (NAD+) catalytic subunit
MNSVDMSVDLAGVTLRNPVVTASGCFASGREMSEFIDLTRIGAVTVKSMTLHPWTGKPTPRMSETPSGMLNAIGLQNKGVDHFLSHDLPWLVERNVPVIASIAGNTVLEFMRVAERVRGARGVVAVEVNISCPNLEDRSNMFAHDPRATHAVMSAVRRSSSVPIFAKLSPNVTSIVEIARAALDGGAHGISLINTVLGMAIDHESARSMLAGEAGGLSGPAIRPIAVRAVFEVHQAFPHIPIIGMGGIMDYRDALEFVLAGATAVGIGTANFLNPNATVEVARGLEQFLVERGIASLAELKGQLKVE